MISNQQKEVKRYISPVYPLWTKKVWDPKVQKFFYHYNNDKKKKSSGSSNRPISADIFSDSDATTKTTRDQIPNSSQSSCSKTDPSDLMEIDEEEAERNKHSPAYNFTNDLKNSVINSVIFANPLFSKFLNTLILGKSLLHIALLVLIFFVYGNLSNFNFEKFFVFLNWLVEIPWSGRILKSCTKFFNQFVSVFIDLITEKIKTPSGTGYMIVYDFEKKMQEKFNLLSYRKALLSGRSKISERFRKKTYLTTLSDINDGTYLRKLYEEELNDSRHFVFQFFIDGVSPFKGCSDSLVPIFLVNLQLPFEERFHLTNMLMIAVVASKNIKLDYDAYLELIANRLNQKLNNFTLEITPYQHQCKALVVNDVMDMAEQEKAVYHSSGLLLLFLRCFFKF